MQAKRFSSERIVFRFPEPNDANSIFQGVDWSIHKNISRAPWPYTLEDAISFISGCENDRKNNSCFEYILTTKDTNEFIGIASLSLSVWEGSDRPGEIGYWITHSFRGRGYGFEVVNEMVKLAKFLKLPMVWAAARHDNLPSINLLKKIGMKFAKERTGMYEGKEMPEVIYEMSLT
jgi:RimJ/RimL family protein N-acetyltransferase